MVLKAHLQKGNPIIPREATIPDGNYCESGETPALPQPPTHLAFPHTAQKSLTWNNPIVLAFLLVLAFVLSTVGCANPAAPTSSLLSTFSYKWGTVAADTLYPISPNPFNRVAGDTSLLIGFALADSGSAQVVIQNVLGDQINIFSDSLLGPGYYNGSWNPVASNGSRLLDGLYFITLRNGDFIFSRLVNIQENQ